MKNGLPDQGYIITPVAIQLIPKFIRKHFTESGYNLLSFTNVQLNSLALQQDGQFQCRINGTKLSDML